jgi:hypothetical protein
MSKKVLLHFFENINSLDDLSKLILSVWLTFSSGFLILPFDNKNSLQSSDLNKRSMS